MLKKVKTEVQLAGALKVIQKLLRANNQKVRTEAQTFLKGITDGSLPKARRFRIDVKKAAVDGFAAYLAGSIIESSKSLIVPEGQTLLNLDAILYSCVDDEQANWAEVASDCISHELLHVVQEILGKEFREASIERSIDKAREQERKAHRNLQK